jgi:hypothetical protein
MKIKFLLNSYLMNKIIFTLMVFLIFTLESIPQFNTGGVIGDRFGRTNDPNVNNTIRRVGIGNFPDLNPPQAAFHINANLMTPVDPIALNFFLPGEVFRTTGTDININAWRLFTGNGTGTEKFSLFVNPGVTDVCLQSTISDLYFNTGGSNERMRILGLNGFVGIGSSIPQFRLHIENDGGILSSGNSFGTGAMIPVGLSNSLFIWNPYKAAFRAGFDNGGNWSDANTGNYSASFGYDNIAAGERSFAIGFENNIQGLNSFAGGAQNTINSPESFVFGANNILNGGATYVFGGSNIVNAGGNLFIAGGSNTLNNNGNFVFGQSNFLDGSDAFTFGEGNTVNTSSNGWATTLGIGNNNNTGLSGIIGSYNITNGFHSYAIGRYLNTGIAATNSFALGQGYNLANPLTNNIANSFMVGFNSNVPTMTVVSPITPGIGATGRVGIANSNPQNTLEITSNTANPSGLRFTTLTSVATPVTNPGAGVLGVDVNGDVIYVDAPAATVNLFANNGASVMNILSQDYVQLGQVNTGIGTLNGGELIHDTEIPFDNYNVYFSDAGSPATGKNRIQFGDFNLASPQNITLFAELTSIRDEDHFGLRIGALNSTSNFFSPASVPLTYNPFYFGNISNQLQRMGTVSLAYETTAGGQRFIGLSGGAFSLNSSYNLGVSGKAYGNSGKNTGVVGIAGSPSCNSVNYGVEGHVNSNGTNFGIIGSATNGLTNYSVYGESFSPVSACGSSISYAGYFNGDIVVNGSILPSDLNLKQNILELTNALSIIDQLEPKIFEFNLNSYPSMNLSSGTQYGLIAQDVEPILPQLVSENIHPAKYDTLGNILFQEVNYKGIKYDQFIPILIKGIQEQNQLIHQQDSINHALEEQINTLYGMISSCCNNNSNSIQNNLSGQYQNNNSLDINLTDSIPNIVLDQNVPNPFAEQTTITYTLTDGVQKAQMLFYNIEGKLIQSVDLSNAAGQGQINVFANDLSTGVYTYSLVVDGQIKGTKRMVKQ